MYRARGVSVGAVAVGTREGTMGVGRRRGARRGGHDGAHILRERAAARQRRRPGYGRTVAAVASVDSPGPCANAGTAVEIPLVVVTPDSRPFQNLDELMAAARENAEPVIAGVNIGAVNHFTMLMLQALAEGVPVDIAP